jgi:hypothetical protein
VTAGTAGAQDVLVARPEHLEQVDVLAERLGRRAPFGWKQILRWAGCQVLARGLDEARAARVARLAQECGLTPRVRPSRRPGPFASWISRHSSRLGRAIWVAFSCAEFCYLYLYDHYNPVGHALGFVWLWFVTRNWTVFAVVKVVAAVAASIGVGTFAMLFFFLLLARSGLTDPLLAAETSVPLTPATAPMEALPTATPARQRRRPLYILGAACVIALTAGALRMHERFPRQFPRSRPSPSLTRALTPLPVALGPARATVEAATRPAPDRRILLAVADLHHMVTGIDRRDAEAVFVGGEWVVRHLDVEVGRLPEFPSFADALRMLRTWATRLEGPGSATASPAAAEPEPPFEQDAFAMLRAAQRRWSSVAKDAQAVRDASVALAALSFAMLDEMEVGDVLPGRAVATLALAENRAETLPRSKALLAYAMGYQREARELASALPAGDPTRSFLEKQDEALGRSALLARSSTWTRYLWLRRVIDLGDDSGERQLRRGRLADMTGSAAIEGHWLHIVVDMRAQGVVDALPRVRESLLAEIGRERLDPASGESAAGRASLRALGFLRALWDSTRSESLLARFDRTAARAASTGEGPFYEQPLVQAYFRASLFTGFLHIESRWLKERDAEQLRRVGKMVRSTGSAESIDVDRWQKELQLQRTALDDYPRPVEALASIVSLGHAPLQLLQDDVADAIAGGKPDKLRAIRLLAARFDTRPEHRKYSAWHAHRYSLDMPEAERICRALLPIAPDSDCARLLGDRDHLLAIVRDPRQPTFYRARVLKSSAAFLGPELVDAAFRALLREDASVLVLDPYVDFLEDRKEYARAREVLLGWLGDAPGRDSWSLTLRIDAARMLYHQRQYEKAWAELEPLVTSGPGAKMRAAYVLAALGRKEEAERIARQRLDEFRDWSSFVLLAEIFWRTGNHAEATRLMLHPPFRLEDTSWGEAFGESFAKAFADRPEAAAQEAFAAARAGGVAPRLLRKLIGHLGDRPALAFQLEASLAPEDAPDVLRAYGYLRKAQGEAAARRWAMPRLRGDATGRVARAIYAAGELELLWSALPDPQPDSVWVLRAAAARLEPSLRDRRTEVAAHFRESADPLGRLLAGIAPPQELTPASLRDTCRDAYFLGVLEEGDGHLADASSWYRVAVQTEQVDVPEFRWARAALLRWSERGPKPVATGSAASAASTQPAP